jgi:hypothetical protein
MIKLKTLLTETIYGNQAIVYHRTKVEDLANKIYTSGFRPGTGDMYGEAMYSTYELASQERPEMAKRYGNIIVKFSVNLTGFMFFDWSEFVKSPLYKDKLKKSTIETFMMDQIDYYGVILEQGLRFQIVHNNFLGDAKFTSDKALSIYKRSNIEEKVAGIVFTGKRDGKVLVCYDVKRLRPIAVKKDGDKEFTKINTTKDFLRKTAANTISKDIVIPNSMVKSADGSLTVKGTYSEYLFNAYPKLIPYIKVIEGDMYLPEDILTSSHLKRFQGCTVKGNINIAINYIESLEGCPKCANELNVRENPLTSLKGCPLVKTLEISSTYLTSLEHCPDSVKELYVSGARLESLKYCPPVLDSFDCSRNMLTSLVGGPSVVNNDVIVADNNLTSLEGAPSSISGNFDCSNNPLVSLEGCPKEVVGNFIHSSEFTEKQIREHCRFLYGKVIKK